MYKEHKGEEGADEGHCDGAVPGMLASELLPRACMGLATVPTPRTNRAMHRLSSKVRVRLRVCVQPLDKLERQEVRREALKYVDKGFQLVAKEKVGFRLCRVLTLRSGIGFAS